ncbi:hypothetical protein TNCV_3910151 [Trichonephila clavipes]|nr:hypothetical protein TNCV_3910151 [Trichonephila clavipes]
MSKNLKREKPPRSLSQLQGVRATDCLSDSTTERKDRFAIPRQLDAKRFYRLMPNGNDCNPLFPLGEGRIFFEYDFWHMTATAGSDVVQSGRPIFDDFFQHLWPYIGNNTANVVFQMVKRLWLIRIDQ